MLSSVTQMLAGQQVRLEDLNLNTMQRLHLKPGVTAYTSNHWALGGQRQEDLLGSLAKAYLVKQASTRFYEKWYLKRQGGEQRRTLDSSL